MSADEAGDDGDGTNEVELRPADERYFAGIESRLDEAIAVAEAARKRGGDPVDEVEIPVAKDMADRVENILGIEGVAARVRELEDQMSREEAALELARDFAEGRVGDYETRAGKVEGAVRTAVALLTEGVVAAPIEGIDGVEFVEDSGREFVRVYYAGPIRSAGGTAQALSVLVADYTRTLLGLDAYEPRSDEVERYAEEVGLYDSTTGLQYTPKEKETKFIARHCPVMLDGEPTGDEEVSGFRDLERVDTNNARGGMCLVLAEGIAQKAPKIKRYTDQLADLDWPWLDDLVAGTIGNGDDAGDDSDAADAADAADADEVDDGRNDEGTETDSTTPRPEPSEKYLRDLIAGRPVFGHPSEPGGFRLRYGRARNHGFATAGVHPATMHIVDDFLATGTQIKTERPGKAAGVVPVDSIEGPTVKLANGDVRRIDDPEEALEVRNGVVAIVDLGEYLVNYGEFLENNHPLAPASYTTEWWLQDFEAAGGDAQAIEDSPRIDIADPGSEWAIETATEYDCPLHPAYTYLWHDLSVHQFEALRAAVAAGDFDDRLSLDDTPEIRTILETLLVPHTQGIEGDGREEVATEDGDAADESISIPEEPALALRASLGFDADGDDRGRNGEGERVDTESLAADGGGLSVAAREHGDAMQAVNEVAPFRIQERAPTRIGNRMGRPEKSEKRELSPAVHTLFPIGEAGGNQRDVAKATDHSAERGAKPGEISARVGRRECTECGTETFRATCPEADCEGRAVPAYECPDCEISVTPDESRTARCPRCDGEAETTTWQTIDLKSEYRNALDHVGERENAFPILKGVKGLTSTHKTPEPMEKGILRAKHGVSTFKDGTVRYDMTDLPVTSVRPTELDVSVDEFRRLGYAEDVLGDPLRHDDQLVELKVQDIVLSDGAAEHLLKTAAFVDDLLTQYYDAEPFYGLNGRDDLVGELVFGMAPHTSAAVVGRVVGFTSAAVGYAHPYFHAAKRRNCDGDEDCVMLLMDGLLNFSKFFLPDKRGGQMDAPLVMSSRIDPSEIDDEAHNMDVVDRYPREFYEATRKMADPGEVDIRVAEEGVGTVDQYTGFRHTHDTSNIALGPALSAYKTLGSMLDKTNAQLELGRKARAVDETDVAERIIEYHFLPDLIGNLRAFSRQETRCLGCGKKYRRVPLSGSCRECGGRVNLTVHEGSVKKYIETATTVAYDYDCRPYTKQRLEILKRNIESVFEDDTNKQSGIADFM